MEIIYQFFKHISENYGTAFAVLFLIIVFAIATIYFFVTTFPEVVKKYIENKILDNKDEHRRGTMRRKSISPAIMKILSQLLVDTNGDRALLFEFSNGTSNLAGLPFLFVNATCESLNHNSVGIAHLFQRVNVSLFSSFILDLEDSNYFFIQDIDELKNTCPYIYSALYANGVRSAIFYSIYGVNDKLGFIMVTSNDATLFIEDQIIPDVVEATQRVSALLNFEGLEETIK